MHLEAQASTGSPELFPELIAIQSQIAHYLKNGLQYLFLNFECYVEHRCITFNGIIISQISVHKCVLHKGKETQTFPRFNAA
jgi:hypothetical protein